MFTKILKKLIVSTVFVFIISLIPSIVHVEASPATSFTFTLNSKGRFVRTQDAYLPDRSVVELFLKNPSDMYIQTIKLDEETNLDVMYIADTGNRRIVVYLPQTNQVLGALTHKEFVSPKGVFVTEKQEIYVADSGAQAIFKFGADLTLLNKFTKPQAPSFEDSPFNPSKIGVDNRGNMFIYGEGVENGIIHLSNSGEFLGYFTSNKVDLTTYQRFLDLIFNEEQQAKLFPRNPITFSSVFVDKNSLVYSTTSGSRDFAVKKHNIAGGNNFSDGIIAQDNAMDVYVDSQGIIYAAMNDGAIYVYSPDGEFIYTFGASNYNKETRTSEDISGLFNKVSAIAVDSSGNVWALDVEKSFLQSFAPTEYATKIYTALNQYTSRQYASAIETWKEVLRLNQMSVLAHNNIGKNYLALQQYELAMEHFEIAGNRDGYSQAFWEVRNITLQKNLSATFIGIILFTVAYFVLKYIDKRKPFSYKIKNEIKKITHVKFIADLLYMFRVLKHPLDSFYELKKGKKGSVLGAIIIYITLFCIFLWYTIGKDFIYQFVAVEDLDMNAIVYGFFALTLLFVICNYLVTSINDGEGGFKQIFVMFAYSLAPLMVSFLSILFLSYILTYNESFFLDLILYVGLGWTGLNIILGVQETHNYGFWKTIKSILITIAFMVIIVLILIIIFVMWDQLIMFIEDIIKEALRNVIE